MSSLPCIYIEEETRGNPPQGRTTAETPGDPIMTSNTCQTCGQDHSVITIGLEGGGYITTIPFPKEKAAKINVMAAGERRATRLDLVNIFWRPEGIDEMRYD